jgi:hypothetical protein
MLLGVYNIYMTVLLFNYHLCFQGIAVASKLKDGFMVIIMVQWFVMICPDVRNNFSLSMTEKCIKPLL